ncbi:hypothetical protein PHYSODRAFT_565301 [Phytophthora sojae]|uniref:Uncharacterized protein n=1 Tax=Phytophthora sojae (strain P6497) TaxID=1094619 RepID=G5A9K0_PHYSP|nr:hypothetical protein PHYSODRAFT_565301 [Phytophthora sojae]EGZ07280.1 hypothetical protein PHYSODRAFT_565301 [Phytophthora sojae]|eukprot:XP_009536846.1 hypothetical protein PHYSODRAFT_565301 [Phytophthora sojae]
MASATPSVDKSESVAVAASLSESPSPSVKGAKAKKSKTSKDKAAVAAVVATQASMDEADTLGNLSLDHPYLSVLYKRLRSHRKKLEKIKGLEAAQAAGDKRLNAQQLELMGSKATLEKLVAELDLLREQFVGVFTQELEQKKQQEEAKKEKEIAASGEETEAAEQVQETEQEEQVAEQQEAAPEEAQELQEAVEKTEQQEKKSFADVYELLKTLHVVNLHQALGKEVPMVLDFFSKVLLGNTRPPAELSYEENLMDSLEEAKKYLTDSDKVFACDTTYSGLLVVVAEVSDVPVVPAEINTMPEISFFTESQLESVQGEEAADEVEQSEEVAESVPAPPLSFAAVTAGLTSERTPSPPRGKNTQRRRGQGRRWKEKGEKGSNSNSGNKSADGSPTNGSKPRRPRAPRASDENSGAQGVKNNKSKENRRPRVERGLRKQNNNSQQHEAPMIAPHA